jgi:hypothetical protein
LSRSVIILVLCLLAVLVGVEIAVPHTTPGRGNPIAALIAVGFLLGGAWFGGDTCQWKPLHFIYGCIGGLFFIPLFYPNNRSFLPPNPSPANLAEDWRFTVFCIIGVILAGLVCRYVAGVSHDRNGVHPSFIGRCQKCDYNLTGNVTGVCSECGEKIEGEGDG